VKAAQNSSRPRKGAGGERKQPVLEHVLPGHARERAAPRPKQSTAPAGISPATMNSQRWSPWYDTPRSGSSIDTSTFSGTSTTAAV